jgi:hypothetical protein
MALAVERQLWFSFLFPLLVLMYTIQTLFSLVVNRFISLFWLISL